MKNFILTAAILLAATVFSYGQGQPPVVDTHPNATIYIYDPQSSQEVLAESDAAILFKDALVNLVSNMSEARMISHSSPGHKTIVITQASPDQGNAYQVEMDDKMFGQTSVLYTFSYNVDQNTLYYFDQSSQTWVARPIQPYNMQNLDDCQAYGKFNDPQSWNEQADDGTGDAVVQANTPPPPLQEEVQPECPVDGYLWQPGYWAYNNYSGNYYWVAGQWVAPPNPGYLWTPPYWGFEGGVFGFHRGYWGVTIGFYGGINYGYGYGGHGYYGGAWEGNHFRYNTAVVRVNVNVVHNTYVDRTVIVNNNVTVNNKVSYNGPGGVAAKPTKEEISATTQKHIIDTKQDPAAPKPNAVTPARGQRGNNGNGAMPNSNNARTPGNGSNGAAPNTNNNRIPGNGTNNTAPNNSRTPGNFGNGSDQNTNKAKTADDGTTPNTNKTPVNGANVQKSPGNNTNTPKTPGRGPGIPRVPGNGPGAVKPNQPVQRQPAQGQKNNNKQNDRSDKNPPQKDKKNP